MIKLPWLRSRRTAGPIQVVHVVAVPFTLRFLRGQASYMRERGVQLAAISSPGVELDDFGEVEGVETLGIPISREISPVADLVSVFRLVRQFRSSRPDIVHTHTPKGGLLGVLSAWIARVPVRIHTIHGLVYTTSFGRKRKLLMVSEQITCRLATGVLCVSDSVRQVAVEDGIVCSRKIAVPGSGSANGIDTVGEFNPVLYDSVGIRVKYSLPPDVQIILFVGRLARDKGINELAQAWASIRMSQPNARLLLAGDVDDRDPVEPHVMRYFQSDSNVTLFGHHSNVAELLAVSNLLVLPTYREGFPTVLLEAAAMALPVVATDIPGCRDAVLDGVTGTLVPVHDAGRLASAISFYLDEPETGWAHGQAGRDRVSELFTPEIIADAIIRKYWESLEILRNGKKCGRSRE